MLIAIGQKVSLIEPIWGVRYGLNFTQVCDAVLFSDPHCKWLKWRFHDIILSEKLCWKSGSAQSGVPVKCNFKKKIIYPNPIESNKMLL